MIQSKEIKSVPQSDPSEIGRIVNYIRKYLVLLLIVALFGIYVALHSPLREVIAGLFGFESRGCFFCGALIQPERALGPLSGLILVTVALLSAWSLADAFRGSGYERPLIFGVFALALIAVPAAAVGEFADLTGTRLLQPPLGPLLSIIPSAVVLALAARRGWRPHAIDWQMRRPSYLIGIMGGTALVLSVSSIAVSLMHPATSGDALGYHAPLAVFLWQDGNLGTFLDRASVMWALAHPGTAELWFGLLRIVGGEAFADLGQLPFAWLGSAAVYAFARRMRLRHGAAVLAAISYLLMPIVVMQIGMQPNDVVGAALVMCAVALASVPVSEWGLFRVATIGTSLGLVITTKLALIPYAAAVGGFVAALVVYKAWKSRAVRLAIAQLLLTACMFLIVVAPWWTRNVIRYGNPIYPQALPILGRGRFIHDEGPVDIAFVPSPVFWPLYPALEPHDDRSGFGALVLVGVIPGFLIALVRAKKQPMVIFLLVSALMLPAWWIFTLHEPRFFMGIIGLSFAFVPWLLLAVPRAQRHLAAGAIAATAVFSALVTLDQGVLPFARQPNTRAEFYDRVWGVDPFVESLPETVPLLSQTGYAPTIPEYTYYYPLLGPTLSRTVIPLDWVESSDAVVEKMRSTGLVYAYVAASPQNRKEVEALYDDSLFELVHRSTVVRGESSGVRRNLLRPASAEEESNGTRRYLFRLR